METLYRRDDVLCVYDGLYVQPPLYAPRQLAPHGRTQRREHLRPVAPGLRRRREGGVELPPEVVGGSLQHVLLLRERRRAVRRAVFPHI